MIHDTTRKFFVDAPEHRDFQVNVSVYMFLATAQMNVLCKYLNIEEKKLPYSFGGIRCFVRTAHGAAFWR